LKFNQKFTAALAGALLLLASGVVLSFWAFRQIEDAAEARKDAFVLLNRAGDLLSALTDAETGERGFALTGDEAFLEPYLAARDGIVGQLRDLRRLTRLSAAQQRLDAVAPLIDAKLAELASVIALRRQNDLSAVLARIAEGRGKRLMDSIRAEIKGYTQIQEESLLQRASRFRSDLRRLFIVIIAASVFAVLLVLALAFTLQREIRQRLREVVHLESVRTSEIQQDANRQLQQTNATLKLSEEKLTASVRDNGDMMSALNEHAIVTIADPTGRIIFANDKFCEISKYTRAELLGHDHRTINSGHHPKEYFRDLWATVTGGRVWHGEIKNHAKDGTFYWVEMTILPALNQRGKPRHYFAIHTDITARKQVEEKLRFHEEILRDTSRIAKVGGWSFEIATGDRFWTEEVARIHDLNSEAPFSKDIGLTYYRPESRKQIEAALQAAIQQGTPYDLELEITSAAGTHKWIRTVAHPVTEQGKVVRLRGSFQDISERKRSEAAMHESEERFRTMANSIPQLAWIARADGFISWYNRRWLEYTGKTSEEMEGWGWQSVHDPVALPRVMTGWQAAIAAGTTFEMEFPLRGVDGSFRIFLTRVEPLKKADGEVVQWFGTNTDVTELKRAEEHVRRLNADLEERVVERTAELQTANKELESFSYTVSHDLRGPVRAIDGFSQAVLEDFGPQLPDEGRRYLGIIRHSAQQMGSLVDGLLAFAQLGRQELSKQTFNTDQLVRLTLHELGSPWEDRRVEIRLGALPESSGDLALMKQVWINLLSNALKYSRKRDKAEIEIGCTTTNGADTFFVRDNGSGFDMGHAKKLFGVFQRLHGSDEFEGTGVGLATVQRIVERHGGRVWADAAVDHGATFFFTLGK